MKTPLYDNRSAVPGQTPSMSELGVSVPPRGTSLASPTTSWTALVVVCPADEPCPPLAVGDVWTFLGASYTVASIQLYGSGTVPAATIGIQAGPDAVTFTTGDVASVATLLASSARTHAASKIQNPYALH